MGRYQLIAGDLFCSDGEVNATGLLEGHFVLVVKEGSTAIGDGFATDERLLKQGVVVRNGKYLKFLMDFPFENPTTAAKYIFGRDFGKKSGWPVWKSAAGQSLRELVHATEWKELAG